MFVRSIIEGAGDWQDADELDCSSVTFRQFVPTCYRPQTIGFNPSGTRLYIHDNINDKNDQRWDTALRIHIDKGDGGLPLDEWILSAPELVYAGTTEHEPGGMVARPGPVDPASELPSPEYIAMNYLDRSGNQTQVIGAIMDADLCAAYYAPHADGDDPAATSDLWKGCLGTSTFVAGNLHGGGDSWQSPDTLLKSTLGKRHYDIYRHDVTDGTEQLLIENARGADTGF